MTPEAALADLRRDGVAQKAADMATYHKAERVYLGVSNPQIYASVAKWRAELDLDGRLSLAADLWDSNIHEARVAAAKLLAQARLRPDDQAAWTLISSWVPQFDAWAIADHVSGAGSKRLVWEPSRLDEVAVWTTSPHMWSRRAALVMCLPWTKQNHPKPRELEARERILGWAAGYVDDPEWFIQKAIAWWLRELSKHDAPRVHAFLEEYGARMKPFARREASKYIAKSAS